jgi:hypothetical protein
MQSRGECGHLNKQISEETQRVGCPHHLYIPTLITFAEPVDSGTGYVAYRHKESGLVFANVMEDCDRSEDNMSQDIVACYTSKELANGDKSIIGDAKVAEFKEVFDAQIITSERMTNEAPF